MTTATLSGGDALGRSAVLTVGSLRLLETGVSPRVRDP
jgi:hypothetical protein